MALHSLARGEVQCGVLISPFTSASEYTSSLLLLGILVERI